MRDFTLAAYNQLLQALRDNQFIFHRFNNRPAAQTHGPHHVILRHDVDRMPARALRMAELEASKNIQSTYFFRTKRVSFNKNIIRKIHSLGHEVGYHYECLSDTHGDLEKAWQLFQQELAKFRGLCEVKSIAMHGRPLLPYDNRDLWDNFDYREAGINLEAYKDIPWGEYEYFTDVGGRWDCENNLRDYVPGHESRRWTISTTLELIEQLQNIEKNIIISTHPERWPGNFPGWIHARTFDLAINQVKKLIRRTRM